MGSTISFSVLSRGKRLGPMHWGHASSEDLSQEEHPIALYPDEMGISSGSAVVDHKTPLVLQRRENPHTEFSHTMIWIKKLPRKLTWKHKHCLLAGRSMTWTKYEGNPVIENLPFEILETQKCFGMMNENSGCLFWLHSKKSCSTLLPPLKTGPTRLILVKQWTSRRLGMPDSSLTGTREKNKMGNARKYNLVDPMAVAPPVFADFDGKKLARSRICSPTDNDNNYWIDFGQDNYAGVTWQNKTLDNGNKLFIG